MLPSLDMPCPYIMSNSASLNGGAILFYYTGQKNTRPGEEHGSASWGSVRELDKKYRDKDAGKNVILTQHLQMSMNGKLHRRNLL